MSIMAQSEVRGFVKDALDQRPLSGILIVVNETGQSQFTDEGGAFKFQLKESFNEIRLYSQSFEYEFNEVLVSLNQGKGIANFQLVEKVLDLPEVVVSSATLTGGHRGIQGIPGTAHYISPKEIQKFNHTDIHRLIGHVPGVQIQEEDGFGLRPNIGLRATGVERSSKITLMEDGVLIAPAPYSAPAAYYFPTAGRMQSIEILKGSSQVKYGPQTTGGALNLISAQIPNTLSSRLKLSGGSFGSRELEAMAGGDSKHFGFLVQTFQQRSDGFKRLADDGSTGFEKEDYLGKLRWHTSSEVRIQQSLTVKAGFVKESANETYLGLTKADFDKDPFRRYAASQLDNISSEHVQLSATHVIQLNRHLHLVTTTYHHAFDRNWYKLDAMLSESGDKIKIASILDDPESYETGMEHLDGRTSVGEEALIIKANNRSYLSKGIQSKLTWNYTVENWQHHLEMGVRLHRDEMDRFQWQDKYRMNAGVMVLEDGGVPGTESNLIEKAVATSAFMQYELSYGKFSLTPGVRMEHVDQERVDYGKFDILREGLDLTRRENNYTAIIPGIGAEYEWSDNFQLFGGIHKGFAPPGSKEGTSPEESVSSEIGVRFGQGGLFANVTGYFSRYSNLLGADLNATGGSGTNDLFNAGRANIGGVEVEMGYVFVTTSGTWQLPLHLSYTYSNAVFNESFDSEFGGWGEVESGDFLPYLSPHRLSFGLSVESLKWQVNMTLQWVDDMLTSPGVWDEASTVRIDGRTTVDASIKYALNNQISLACIAKNVFDQKYVASNRPAGWRPGLPRTLLFAIEGRF
jgi:Fe(3+) dicitrate transport protein